MDRYTGVDQVNIRMPSDLKGHVDALARNDGLSTPKFLLNLFESEADRLYLQIGRETVMEELREEYEAQVAHYNAYFDDLEARQKTGTVESISS